MTGRSERYAEQVRAKYTEAEVTALGEKGEAFKNPDGTFSYPVGDVADLTNAIHAVGRGGADHDAIRKYIIGRADALGEKSLIPDNWNADGSLADEEKAAAWDAHLRAGQLTYSDLCDALSSALADKYTPVESNSAPPLTGERLPAVPKRAFSSLIETPPPVVCRFGYDTTADLPFVGYASTVDTSYSVCDWLGEYDETIRSGAFDKTLSERNVPLLFDHAGEPLASTQAATSVLVVDARGLRNEANLNSKRESLIEALRRGDLNKMSFSFRAITDEWDDDYQSRAVTELALYDTSIVTYPANPHTSADLRSAALAFLGREGRAVMRSARSALPLVQQRTGTDMTVPVYERAINALGELDSMMCARFGRQGRARVFLAARLLVNARQGRVLSAANETLLRQALDALHEADDHLTGIDSALDDGQAAISQVLAVPDPDGDAGDPDDDGQANTSGLDGDGGGGNGAGGRNPISPTDGAGPRSALPASVVAARSRLELLKLRR
jgi:HK97 family phage prohead protease